MLRLTNLRTKKSTKEVKCTIYKIFRDWKNHPFADLQIETISELQSLPVFHVELLESYKKNKIEKKMILFAF